MTNHGEILGCRTDDGTVRLDVRLQDETVWLTQAIMAWCTSASVTHSGVGITYKAERGQNRAIAAGRDSRRKLLITIRPSDYGYVNSSWMEVRTKIIPLLTRHSPGSTRGAVPITRHKGGAVR